MTARRSHTLATHLGGALIALALASAPDAAAAQCGDGAALAPEECDDGNVVSGDGCSDTCQLEDASALCAGVTTHATTNLAAVRVASGLAQPVQVTAPPSTPTACSSSRRRAPCASSATAASCRRRSSTSPAASAWAPSRAC